MYADLVLKSNLIYKGRGKETQSGGVAIKDNLIIGIGSDEEIDKYMNEDTVVRKYEDKLIMPGFIDGHVHLSCALTTYVDSPDLHGTKSIDECVKIIEKHYKTHPDAPFIEGVGWLLNGWDVKEYPSKADLDAISTEIPICLLSADGWYAWVNSKALEVFGYTKENVEKEQEAFIFKDEQGELTGILFSEGVEPTYFLGLMVSKDYRMNIAQKIVDEFTCNGVTAVAEMSAETSPKKEPEAYATFKDLDKMGGMNLRMSVFPAIGKDVSLDEPRKILRQYSDETCKVQAKGLKMYIDGVVDGHTAFMLEPYEDTPGERSESIYEQELANQLVHAAHKIGVPVRFHALGDAGVRLALNAIEYAQTKLGDKSLQDCIEHINFVAADDKKRFVEQGTIASIQPTHQMLFDDSYIKLFGEERWKSGFPLQSMLDTGVKVAINTDYGVVEINPFYTLYVALSRRNRNGESVGMNPAEKAVNIFEMLESYTYTNALAIGMADKIGTLEVGKFADVIVADGPVIDETPEEILMRTIETTVFDGKVVYEKEK